MPNSFFSQPVYIPGGNPETMNEPEDRIKPGQLGIRFSYNIPARSAPGVDSQTAALGSKGLPKAYKMVRTDSAMSVAPYSGAVAWWENQALYCTTTSPTALGRGRVAGVFRTAVTPGNICCVQVRGKGLVKFIDAVVVANVTDDGNFVIPSATAGKADVIAAGTAATYPTLGLTAGTLLADASAIVDLNVPEVD